MENWEADEKQRQDTDAAAAADEGWTVVTKQRVGLLRQSFAAGAVNTLPVHYHHTIVSCAGSQEEH